MDIVTVKHVIVLLSSMVLASARPSTPSLLNALPRIVSCRATCLDTFSNTLQTEALCRSVKDCKMCWDTCELLHSSFHTWGSICAVQAICFPGCQQACSSVSRKTSEAANQNISIHSLYDLQADQVTLEWEYPQENKTQGTMLYAVLLRDRNDDDNHWDELTQTTAHSVLVKRGLLNRDTIIRLIGADAVGQMTDVTTSYLDSLIAESKNYLNMENDEEERSSIQIMNSPIHWRPQLLSLIETPKSTGVHATVTWAFVSSPGVAQYEVSWNVIDDTIEITGHLHTAGNTAVLTLWPDALYAVQLNAYVDGEIKARSEPLLIDTRIEKPVSSDKIVCKGYKTESDLFMAYIIGILLFLFLMSSMIYFAFLIFIRRREWRNTKANKKSHADGHHIGGKLSIIHSVNVQPSPNSILVESRDTLVNGKTHTTPCYILSQPLKAQCDIENPYISENLY